MPGEDNADVPSVEKTSGAACRQTFPAFLPKGSCHSLGPPAQDTALHEKVRPSCGAALSPGKRIC